MNRNNARGAYSFVSRLSAVLLLILCAIPVAAAQGGEAPLSDLAVLQNSSQSTSMTVNGQGTKPTAIGALEAAESHLKNLETKMRTLAKGKCARQSHGVSFSNPTTYPVSDIQSWSFTFTANYLLENAKDGAVIADELSKITGVSVSVSSDVQGN